MPSNLVSADPAVVRVYEDACAAELVGRNCRLLDYQKQPVAAVGVGGELIAYASPDATYAVTRRLVEQAHSSIRIGLYDFSARYMAELLLRAMRRGVSVSLLLDLDNRSGETPLFDDLVQHGCDGVPAPSCASTRARYFPSFHEKVIVIDDTWVLIQSGNWTENSVPQNERDGGDAHQFFPGNRDMGLAVNSKPLAAYFTRLLDHDRRLELSETAGEIALGELAGLAQAELFQAAPAQPPPVLFPSQHFRLERPIQITPVLSPENYMDVVPSLLEQAQRSIAIEQQYIRGQQPEVRRLLEAIRAARRRNPHLDVRIVLAMPFPGRGFDREAKEIRDLQRAFGLKLGTNIRILNPKYFVHCHNKLVIVDEQSVLIGSQNWSDFAVSKNREASLLLRHAPLARYYASIFHLDWDTGLQALRRPRAAFFAPQALGTGKVVPLRWGDYVEV